MTMPPPIPTSPESTPANIPKLRLPRNDFTRTSVALSKKIRLHFANQSRRPAEAGRLRERDILTALRAKDLTRSCLSQLPVSVVHVVAVFRLASPMRQDKGLLRRHIRPG